MGYFCDFDGCFFEPTTIELEQDLIKIRDVFRYSPQKSYFLSRYAMPSIRAFYVHPTGPTLPSTPAAYQMAGGTSYVFLLQRPEKMCSVARFNSLHEIGHAVVTNHVISKRGWFTAVHFCLLFVFVALHREAGILALLVAFALAAMWAFYLRQQVRQQGNTDNRLELVADAFALVHLAGRPDFRTAIARIACTFRRIARTFKRSDDVLSGAIERGFSSSVLSSSDGGRT